MQLGWFNFNKSKQSASLDSAPLKKIVAVSDEYWDELYAPVVKVVNQVAGSFEKQSGRLYKDYVDQFVQIIRRSKGAVQDDPLIVHLQTYSLVVALSALYVGRLCSGFEFHSISTAKKSIGERKQYFPWLALPNQCERKLKKADLIQPVYVISLPVMGEMLSSIGKEWLQSKPVVFKQLLNAVYSNGESGQLAAFLGELKYAPLAQTEEIKVVVSEDRNLQDNVQEGAPSLDDLISDIGGEEAKDVSLDELLQNGGQEQFAQTSLAENQKPTVKDKGQTEPSGAGMDMSFFETQGSELSSSINTDKKTAEDETLTPKSEQSESNEKKLNSKVENSTSQPVEQTDTEEPNVDPLDEFQSFLASAQGKNDNEAVSPESLDNNGKSSKDTPSLPELDVNVPVLDENTLTSELIKWAVKTLPQADDAGLCGYTYNGVVYLAIQREAGVMSFVRADYDLDSEAEYKVVAEEVLNDLAMSKAWVENEEGGDTWVVEMDQRKTEVLLINVTLSGDINGVPMAK